MAVARAALGKAAAIVRIGVQLAEFGLAHHGGDEAAVSVRPVYGFRIGVKVDGERVLDSLDKDFLVETVLLYIVGCNAPITPTHPHGVVKSGVVGVVGVRVNLNVAANAFNDFGGLNVGLGVCRVNLDAWALLALLVGHLAAIPVQLVDCQDRARFEIAGVL